MLDIADRRTSEHAGIFPAELGRAFVTDAKSRIGVLGKYVRSRLRNTKRLLIMKVYRTSSINLLAVLESGMLRIIIIPT
jgi:hypothetical protein